MPFSSGTYSLYTPGNPVVSGTTISSSTQNNTMNDIATGLSTCLLKDGTQTATAIIPFASGITVSAGNTFSTFTTGTTSTTFTFDGSGGTSAAVTLTWQRINNWVVLNIPAVSATSGTSSTVATSNTAFAAGARPTTAQIYQGFPILNNGAAVASIGYVVINTTGTIQIYRDSTGAVFTDASSCGTSTRSSIFFFVG